ncbi:MAG: hypothetical protein PHX54_02870 [Lentimicrobiaceae bacterium]|nr:hypothetical protein [Lentimicrobiaceae bacterium]
MDRKVAMVRLVGLLKNCPAVERKQDCCFGALQRGIELKQCYTCLSNKADAELEMLYRSHLQCFNNRIQSALQSRYSSTQVSVI